MNAHKLNIKSIKEQNRLVKQERQHIKDVCSRAANTGNKQIHMYIDYSENINWLKSRGFKVIQGEDVICNTLYLISWEDC